MNLPRYLYRGVNFEMHDSGQGLTPYASGKTFKQPFYFGDSGDPDRNTYWGDGSTFGESETNAVIKHQQNSFKNQTSGISTTPNLENAKRYAIHKHATGYIYQIDTHQLSKYKVSAYVVEKHATKPAIPENQEVILVAADYGPLPIGIVVNIIEVAA